MIRIILSARSVTWCPVVEGLKTQSDVSWTALFRAFDFLPDLKIPRSVRLVCLTLCCQKSWYGLWVSNVCILSADTGTVSLEEDIKHYSRCIEWIFLSYHYNLKYNWPPWRLLFCARRLSPLWHPRMLADLPLPNPSLREPPPRSLLSTTRVNLEESSSRTLSPPTPLQPWRLLESWLPFLRMPPQLTRSMRGWKRKFHRKRSICVSTSLCSIFFVKGTYFRQSKANWIEENWLENC